MYLHKLQIINFKNLINIEAEFSPFINCFLGENGSGKTNLLDVIYYLCLTKSAFVTSDIQAVNFNKDFFRLVGNWIVTGQRDLVEELTFSSATKKIMKIDGEEYEKMSAHIGRFPLVMIAPDDTDLIREGSEIRRRFFDGILCQLDTVYMENLITYNYIVKQRNALLKKSSETRIIDKGLFETYDEKLISLCQKIAVTRQLFIEQFKPLFIDKYLFISSEKEQPGLKYASDSLEEDFSDVFRRAFEKDLAYQRTTKGIHTDEYEFEINKVNVKKTASQGQKKSFSIALKLAQFDIIKAGKGVKPLLLLDDIFDKLDDKRIEKLIDLVANDAFGQIFVTDARPERSIKIFESFGEKVKRFIFNNGSLIIDN